MNWNFSYKIRQTGWLTDWQELYQIYANFIQKIKTEKIRLQKKPWSEMVKYLFRHILCITSVFGCFGMTLFFGWLRLFACVCVWEQVVVVRRLPRLETRPLQTPPQHIIIRNCLSVDHIPNDHSTFSPGSLPSVFMEGKLPSRWGGRIMPAFG